MGSRFSIEAVVSMVDRVSNPMKNASRSVSAFSSIAQKKTALANRAMSGLRSQIGAFVGIGTVIALGKQFLDFDQAVTAASAKFPGLQKNTEAGQRTLEQLRMTARKVGAETEHSATQAAAGLDFLAMAGFSAKQSMSLLPGVADLATVANTDFARATDIASDAIGAFGQMTNDSAQLAKNFTRIQDVMAATITATNTNMEDLFEAIKFGAPAFTAAGQEMETFNAIAGRMAANGIKGTNAGTALRAGIIRLAAPPRKAAAAIAAMGLRTTDSSGRMRNMIDILADIEQKTKKMTQQQKLASLEAIFGKNAFSAYASILNEGVDQTKALESQLQDSTGASKRMADIMRGSLMNQLKGLLSALTELGFSFLEAFSKQGSDGIKTLTEAVRGIIPAIRVFAKFVAAIIPYLKYALILYGLWRVALIAVMITQKGMIALGWIKYLVMMRGAIFKAISATKAWAIVQKIMNVILTANPIGLIVVGIAALIAFIIIAIKNWNKFGAAMTLLLGPLGMVISMFKTLYDRWDEVKRAFQTEGLIAGFKKLGLVLYDALLYPMQQLNQLLSKIPVIGEHFRKNAEKTQKFREKHLGAKPDPTIAAAGRNQPAGFASPESQRMANGTTTTTNGNVNINVKGQKEFATVKQDGKMPVGTKLNLGLQ